MKRSGTARRHGRARLKAVAGLGLLLAVLMMTAATVSFASEAGGGARAVLAKKVDLYGNYTYEKATFEAAPYEGNDIPAVPRHRINLGFRIHDLIPNLIFSADYNYVGSSFLISDQANNLAKLDDYYTIDTRLSYTLK